jgi:hypothetical protein
MPQRTRDVELALALAHFANDYHSGQWSRGYRLLCAVQRRVRRWGWSDWRPLDIPLSVGAEKIYRRLVARYADKV